MKLKVTYQSIRLLLYRNLFIDTLRSEVKVDEAAAWFAASLPAATGIESATAATDDVRYKPCDHGRTTTSARAYLSWEVALVEQIKRDPTIRFRAYD